MIDFNTLSLASCFQSCFSMLNALPQLIGIKFSREEDSLKSPDVFFSCCCWVTGKACRVFPHLSPQTRHPMWGSFRETQGGSLEEAHSATSQPPPLLVV